MLKKTSNFKRHMNNQNDINSRNNQVETTPKELSFNLFSDDKEFSFVYKKTERMVTAIYMITNFFGDNEPLKWKLRNNSGELLSDMIMLKQVTSGDSAIKEKVLNILSEMLSLFTVAHYAGIVSDMNYKILQTEFVNLINAITDYTKRAERSAIYFDKDFFGEISTSHNVIGQSTQEPNSSKGHNYIQSENKRTESEGAHMNRPAHKGHYVNTSDKDVSSSPGKTTDNKANVSEALKDMYDVKTASDVKKTSRRSLIINTIRKKGKVMIKDLTPVIKGCSAKTIQRELGTLVEKGILKKEGERRWSTYSIA